MKIAIVGLGFVGLSFASVLGAKGYSVIGIDSDTKKISKIRSGKAPFYEPKLNDVLNKALKKSLKIYTDLNSVTNQCDIIFITVGTPQTRDGDIDLEMVKSVIEKIGIGLLKTKNKPTIVIKSTIVPGTTKGLVKLILEKKSKKIAGKKFGIITNPEFLREGKAIDDTLNPHLVVIGGEDDISIRKVKKFYKALYGQKVPLIITNYETAEMIKYANNSFLATKISFINQIANICQLVPETNVERVAKAIGMDPRIGSLFLKAGPGYGGSCLPKDLRSLITFASKKGINPLLLKAVQRTNAAQLNQIIALIESALVNIGGKKITILGLSFKEDSDDIRESVSIKMIKYLLKKNVRITVHDPKAIENTRVIFGNKIRYANSIKDALRNSQCVVIMTPWYQYSRLTNNDFKVMKKRIVVDTRRLLLNHKLNVRYHAVGIGS